MKIFFGYLFFLLALFGFIFRGYLNLKLFTFRENGTLKKILGVDIYRLFVPEFCSLKKIEEQIPYGDEDLLMYIKKLAFSKFTLLPSFGLLYIYFSLFATRL